MVNLQKVLSNRKFWINFCLMLVLAVGCVACGPEGDPSTDPGTDQLQTETGLPELGQPDNGAEGTLPDATEGTTPEVDQEVDANDPLAKYQWVVGEWKSSTNYPGVGVMKTIAIDSWVDGKGAMLSETNFGCDIAYVSADSEGNFTYSGTTSIGGESCINGTFSPKENPTSVEFDMGIVGDMVHIIYVKQ